MKNLMQIDLKLVIVGFFDLNRPKEDKCQVTFKKKYWSTHRISFLQDRIKIYISHNFVL